MNHNERHYNAGGQFIQSAKSDFLPLMLMGVGIALGMYVSNELFRKLT